MDTPPKTTSQFLIVESPPSVQDGGVAHSLAALAMAIENGFTAAGETLREEGVRSLPAEVRHHRVQQVLSGIEPVRQKIKAQVEATKVEIGKLEKALLDPEVRLTPGYDPRTGHSVVAEYGLEREARDILRSMDPLEVKNLYLEAAANNDIQTMRAVELAPRVKPLVSADVLRQGVEIHARRANPAGFQALEDRRAALIHLAYLDQQFVEARKATAMAVSATGAGVR